MAFQNYKPSEAGFKKLATSPQIRAALDAVARKAETIAEGLSQDFRDTGEYADSFEIRSETIDWTGQYPGRRAAARLQNTSGHAAAVEYGYAGSSGTPGQSAHHVLARTLDALKDT